MADHMRRNILDFGVFEFQGTLVMPRELEANWKVAVDNYLECLHCGPTHPTFRGLFDMKLNTAVHSSWTVQSCGIGDRNNAAFHIGSEERNDRAFFYWLFPNTCFTVIPGDPPHVMVQIFQPLAANRTNGRTDMYASLGSKPNVERNNWLSTVTGPEDRVVCESVQRGLQSKGFGDGRLVFDPMGGELTEECVHRFQTMVSERISPRE
jgi:phenylpropionate dioxygenase-like ring-hydroxylating dioxygenase large terminal subunit